MISSDRERCVAAVNADNCNCVKSKANIASKCVEADGTAWATIALKV